jgi:membrane protein implicated in regulation of membrane protease activity
LRLIWLLLLIPYGALLWVPFYNKKLPELFGFPFFYWYQLLLVPVASLLTYIVYRRVRHDR